MWPLWLPARLHFNFLESVSWTCIVSSSLNKFANISQHPFTQLCGLNLQIALFQMCRPQTNGCLRPSFICSLWSATKTSLENLSGRTASVGFSTHFVKKSHVDDRIKVGEVERGWVLERSTDCLIILLRDGFYSPCFRTGLSQTWNQITGLCQEIVCLFGGFFSNSNPCVCKIVRQLLPLQHSNNWRD